MKTINNHNLPEALYNACVAGNQRPERGVMRATGLADSPLIRILTIEHWDDIVVDASDMLWSVYGRFGHAIMEQFTPDNMYSEERFSVKKDGVIVTGQPDQMSETRIEDWKFTSVWSILLGLKQTWIGQMNIYDWGLRETGIINAKELYVNAMLRDWMRGKVFEEGYPKIPYMRKQVPKWDAKKQDEYISQRISLHKDAERGIVSQCTKEEMWETETKYAVKKKGAKRAVNGGVHSSLTSAQEMADSIKGAEVEVRIGKRIRCEDYCNVNKFCPYYNSKE